MKDLESCVKLPKLSQMVDSDGEPYECPTEANLLGPSSLKQYISNNIAQQCYDLHISKHPPRKRRNSNYIRVDKRTIDNLYIEEHAKQ